MVKLFFKVIIKISSTLTMIVCLQAGWVHAGVKPGDTPDISVTESTAKNNAAVSRGQLLYENHCGECHDRSVHTRKKYKSKSIADINRWVIQWSTHKKLEWSSQEIGDVVKYLNNRYYQYTE